MNRHIAAVINENMDTLERMPRDPKNLATIEARQRVIDRVLKAFATQIAISVTRGEKPDFDHVSGRPEPLELPMKTVTLLHG